MEQRIAKANQIRGLVCEYGLVAPKQISHLRAAIPCWLEDAENRLTSRFRKLLNGVWVDLLSLDQRVKELDQEITAIAAADPVAKRLQQLRGVGPMIATALLATVGDASQFANWDASPTVANKAVAIIGPTPRSCCSLFATGSAAAIAVIS